VRFVVDDHDERHELLSPVICQRIIGFLLGSNPAVAGREETVPPVGGRLRFNPVGR